MLVLGCPCGRGNGVRIGNGWAFVYTHSVGPDGLWVGVESDKIAVDPDFDGIPPEDILETSKGVLVFLRVDRQFTIGPVKVMAVSVTFERSRLGFTADRCVAFERVNSRPRSTRRRKLDAVA